MAGVAQIAWRTGAGMAPIYAAPGEKEAAFEWLGRAADAKALALYALKYSRNFDPLRADPRFPALEERVASVAVCSCV